MTDQAKIAALAPRLDKLSTSQLSVIENIVTQFERSFDFKETPGSNLISPCVLREFGDTLRIHHCFSDEPFTKDKFEYAAERVFTLCGTPAQRAPKGNPGRDIVIGNEAFSLKTEAARDIRDDLIHISKFMELGHGQWGTDINDYVGLRDQFFAHMRSYDRIITLRYLRGRPDHFYELVEIPKTLLLEAAQGQLMQGRSQAEARSGRCRVVDAAGTVKFDLYFDGAGERKLQIQKLRKDLCVVHATWSFAKGAAITEETAL